MKEMIVASTNEGKIKEIQRILQEMGIQAIGLREAMEEEIEVEETGSTFQENAYIKAKTISDMLQKPVLADDSGLEVDALDKQPGIYSARFLGKDTSYEIKNQHIIDAVKGKDRAARFVCAMALVIPGKEPIIIQETMEGQIHTQSVGHHGFGYDPIFFFPPCNKTSAEMSVEEKNLHSHRGKALQQLKHSIQEVAL